MAVFFETERLTIKGFEEEFLNDFISYRNNPEWMKYQSFKGKTKEEYRTALLKENNLSRGTQFAVINKENGKLIGDMYLQKSSSDYYLGYTISPEYSRKGYMFEAVTELKAVLRDIGARSIIAVVSNENTASEKLLIKLGFSFTGMFSEDEKEYSYFLY